MVRRVWELGGYCSYTVGQETDEPEVTEIGSTMTHFGDQLRLERERRGVSLETMCARTKLSLRQVLDLEAENYGNLPGGIFRKGFVKSYIGVLGLEEQTWLERFEASYRSSGFGEPEADWAGFAENVRNNRLKDQGSRQSGRWLGVLAMLVVLAAVGWCVWHFMVQPRWKGFAPIQIGSSLSERFDRGKTS